MRDDVVQFAGDARALVLDRPPDRLLLGLAAPAPLLADVTLRRPAHLGAVEAEADQDRHGKRSGGQPPADAGPAPMDRATLAGLRDQAADGGMEPVDARCNRWIAAIHRQDILGEVVAADRQEIGFGSDQIGGRGGSGRGARASGSTPAPPRHRCSPTVR